MTAPAGTGSYRVTISPASTHLTGTAGGVYHGSVTVTDAGAPVKISVSLEGLTPTGPKCTIPHGAPSWLVLNGGPGSFTLAGGQSRVVPFTVHAPAGLADSAAVTFAAVPVHQVRAAARVNLSMGSRVTIGTAATCTVHPAAVPSAASTAAGPGGLGSGPLGLIVAGAVLVAALAVVLMLARRHRRADGG